MVRPKKTKGSLVVDKSFPSPVGRIRRRTGLVTKDQMSRLRSCLQELWSRGRTTELILFRDRKIDSSRVVQLVGFPERLDPDTEFLQKPLFETLEPWMEGWYTNPGTRFVYLHQLKRLRDETHGEPLVSDLPRVLEDYKRSCRNRGVTEPFIQIRQILKTFVSRHSFEKRKSRLYELISDVVPFTPLERKTIGRNNSRNPFESPSQLDQFFKDLNVPEDIREWILFMCLTGIHRKEIENGIEVVDGRVRYFQVFGTRTSSRYDRIVPIVKEIPEVELPKKHRIKYVMKKMDSRSEYDCRRTFSAWCLNSGIPQLHISTYVGHSAGQIQTTEYQRQEVLNWIDSDRNLLLDWMEQNYSEPPRVETHRLPISRLDDLGESRKHLRLSEVRDELDRVLREWYRDGFLDTPYRLRSGCFETMESRQTFLSGKIPPKNKTN